MTSVDRIRQAFRGRLAGDPLLVASPGRINLIGEHTDYNDGFVLPAAIDKTIVFALAPRRDKKCRFVAVDLDDSFEASIDHLAPSPKHWPNYLVGVVDQLQRRGYEIAGFDCAFGGDVPIGSGLSSSAAVEAGLAFALNEAFKLGIEKLDLVRIARAAENDFVGVQCGIMDQFANIFGKAKKVVQLDCRSLEYAYVPFERTDVRIVLCDTRIKRDLAASEYNIRRNQCEAGVLRLQKDNPQIRSLRDVSRTLLEDHEKLLEPVIYRRCKYVVAENDRVVQASESLRRGDIASLGKLMNASHRGLRDEYQVSCAELDALADIAISLRGVFGARMMGGGFGGCTINLVEDDAMGDFERDIRSLYRQKVQKDIKVSSCSISNGTSLVN
ncbi:MAG: galactokinase [Bacteroidota bacterium]